MMATAKAQRQHYLPATFLAGFSMEEAGPRRKRPIAVGDKLEQKCFVQRAENVGWMRNLYSDDIDRTWSDIEARLAPALDELVEGTIDALTWAGTLVPFAASVLVRAPEFDRRMEKRIEQILGDQADGTEFNTGAARSLEMQRILAPIMAAHWIVSSVAGEGELITNDAGFVGFQAPEVGARGIAIPLGRHHVLQLVPSDSRGIVVARGGLWYPLITHNKLRAGNHTDLNETATKGADRFVYGSNRQDVGRFLSTYPFSGGQSPEPGLFGFVGKELARRNEFSWHWLVSILSKPVDDRDVWVSGIDWKAVASQWKCIVVFPLNQQMGTPGLTRVGDTIFIDLQAATPGAEENH